MDFFEASGAELVGPGDGRFEVDARVGGSSETVVGPGDHGGEGCVGGVNTLGWEAEVLEFEVAAGIEVSMMRWDISSFLEFCFISV